MGRRTAALVACLLLAGCGAAGDPDVPAAPSILTRAEGSGARGEMQALVGGTLEENADGTCLLLSGYPVVWPAGTSVTDHPLEVHLPNGETASLGDTVLGTGGIVEVADLERLEHLVAGGDVGAARECLGPSGEVTIFHAQGEGLTVQDEASGP